MSDADDQMGGSGGDTGMPPEKVVPGRDNAAPREADDSAPDSESEGEHPAKDHDAEDSEASFPASDPPGNY
jgi:hypothetical protein